MMKIAVLCRGQCNERQKIFQASSRCISFFLTPRSIINPTVTGMKMVVIPVHETLRARLVTTANLHLGEVNMMETNKALENVGNLENRNGKTNFGEFGLRV